jgi:hypothetical protein
MYELLDAPPGLVPVEFGLQNIRDALVRRIEVPIFLTTLHRFATSQSDLFADDPFNPLRLALKMARSHVTGSFSHCSPVVFLYYC